MDGDAFRSAGTTDADADHFRRPRPEIHNQLTGGMDIGYAFDEDGIPEDDPTSIPENVLTNHWLKVGASGSGKTINTIAMLLSLHENVDGPTILVDPKSGDMVENYAKSHAATFEELRSVQVFNVPEVLPAIPFFDIRPYLHEGMNRDDAIQQKVDEFHLVMEMVDDNYSTAYVAKTVLGALIKSQFDARHGADSFTLDDLYSTAVGMYADQTIPRVSHQPQVARILTNQLNNSEQDFKNTMQAVINRLDDLQEDINLYRLFNQNPEWDDEKGAYKTNGTSSQEEYEEAKQKYEKKKENGNLEDGEDPPEPPHSALDFRELLTSDKVILFDTGDFVRDESQQAFSMYILSALWGAVRSRYNDRKSHETVDSTVNLVIEEAAPIVATELVTNTLIPEAREFGLSLGMVMQFPEQVRKHSDSDTYNELITNVQSKIIGQLEPDNRIVESLVHGDKDSKEIQNKIRQLSGGEWIADLPAPQFGADVPPPFSIKSLGIPEGHPEGDEAFDEQERKTFYRLHEQRKGYVANRHGYRRPSAEEIANRQSAGDAVGFEDTDAGTNDDTADAQPTPGVPGDSESADETEAESETDDSSSSDPFGGSNDEDNSEVTFRATAETESDADTTVQSEPASPDDSEVADTEDQQEAQATSSETTTTADTSSETPDFGSLAPLPQDDIEDAHAPLEIDGPAALANTAKALLEELPEETYHRSLLTLSHAAAQEGISITPAELHESAKNQVSSGQADAEAMEQVTAPTGESTPHASDVDEGSADTDSPGDGGDDTTAEDTEPEHDDSETSDPTPGTPDDDTSSDSDGDDGVVPPGVVDKMLSAETNAEEQDAEDSEKTLGEELLEEEQTADEDSEEQKSESAEQSQHPTNVSLETPLQEAYADFNLDRHDDHEFSEDDKQFMAYIAAAFRDELAEYSLTDSMTQVRDRAGNPDVDGLIDCGYIDDARVQRKRYYSLTRKGWRVVSDSVPGNEFGDHMEKMPHRVGVYLLSQYLSNRSDIAFVEEYAEHNGETYDIIGYDDDSKIVITGEVETSSNNPDAVIDDYQKLVSAPGEVIWAHPSQTTHSEVWEGLSEEVIEENITSRAAHRTPGMRKYLEENDVPWADDVRTYSELEED